MREPRTILACWLGLMLAALLTSAPGASGADDIVTPTLPGGVPPLDEDQAALARVLKRVALPTGVDYASLHGEHADLDLYRAQLASCDLPAARPGKMALFIDAYNAWTLALVERSLPANHQQWPAWSIKDLGSLLQSPWSRYRFELAHHWYTLDQVENDILRPLGDPGIHFAINCASKSCPTLSSEPYLAARLDAQLDEAARRFCADPTQVRTARVVEVNPILDWFSKDFLPQGGARAFLMAHVGDPGLKSTLATAKLSYFTYDWHLNLASPSP